MNAKHTPGPWTLHKFCKDNVPFNCKSSTDSQSWTAYTQAVGAGEQLVAELTAHFNLSHDYDCGYPRIGSVSELDANARLISAAPELLEALERILYAHDSQGNGAAMGEANLCSFYATMARCAIAKAKGEA